MNPHMFFLTATQINPDDPSPANPSSPTADPSSQTVERMVRKAVELIGGFKDRIKSGMTVLIKPNIVELNQPSRSVLRMNLLQLVPIMNSRVQ